VKPSISLEAPHGSARRGQLLELLAGPWRVVPVLIALVGIWIFFSLQSSVFLSSRNLSNLALQIVVMSVIGLALVLVLLVGEIDLSVAYLSAVCAAVAATLSVRLGWPFALALAGGVGAGALWGLGQGLVTTRFRVPSFIVTLGASLILTGVLQKLLPSDTYEIGLVNDPIALIANAFLPSGLSFAGVAAAVVVVGLLKLQTHRQRRQYGFKSSLIGTVLAPAAAVAVAGAVLVTVFDGYRGVPVAVAVLLILLGLFAYLTRETKFGVYLYAIGGNPEAARRAGIPVNRVKVIAFVLAGALAAAGGIIAASRVLGVSPLSADPLILLESIAAIVIGGTSLFGGRGSVWSALTGALVMGSITNGLLLIDVSTPVRLAVQGTILILAVVTDAVIVRRHAAAP
jgi:D-xylose transport system permease protein